MIALKENFRICEGAQVMEDFGWREQAILKYRCQSDAATIDELLRLYFRAVQVREETLDFA